MSNNQAFLGLLSDSFANSRLMLLEMLIMAHVGQVTQN